ncbi:MAG TPA: NAD+ synthase [Gemmatimonadales bacterium]|nr:NAD+ synthase [Gemmatimonadales bacterium]
MRLAIAQFRPKKGDYAANLAKIGAILADVGKLEPRVSLVVTPETATSGYFLEGGVRDVAVTAGTLFQDLVAVHQESKAPAVDISVGFYEIFRNRFHNSCLYATLDGKKSEVRHVHRKIFLPTYGVFDEERYVERGNEGVHAFETGWGGRAAVLICEDAWHSIAGTIAALDGAQLILVPSASPARGTGVDEEGTRLPASMVRWEQVVRGMAGEHGIYVALASLVGFEGGKGFPGGSVLVGPSGEIVSRAPLFDEGLMVADVDLDQITHVRADSPLLADLEVAIPHLKIGEKKKSVLAFDPPSGARTSRTPTAPRLVLQGSPLPRVHGVRVANGDPLAIDTELVNRWLVAFLRDEVVERRKFTKGIVGLSGGVDSALTAFLAVQALGRENVIGVRMPYRTSSPESLAHAQLVIDKLGIPCETIDISAAVDGYLAQAPDAGPARKGNVMARERMIALFDLSERHKALPLGTGNKSERLLGYFTWHADDTPPVNPLGDLFKTQVWALARHVGVPEAIVSKPATADLVAGQTDEGDFGISYPKADRILYELISGRRPADVPALGFTAEEVERVRSRLDATHWKRRLPTVAMLSQTAIGEFYLRPVDY